MLLSVLQCVLISSLVVFLRQPIYIILDLYQVYILVMIGVVIIDNHSYHYHVFNIQYFNKQLHINLCQTVRLRLGLLAGLELQWHKRQ